MTETNSCPDPQQLQAFVRGALDEADAQVLVEHVDACSACDAELARLEADPDSLVAGLRRIPELQGTDTAQPFGNERELSAAVQNLMDTDSAQTFPWQTTSEMTDESADPLSGARIGPYRINHLLGQGGMGRVYHAERVDYEQIVAIKIIRQDLGGEELVRRFKAEISFQARVSQHPKIAGLLDAGVTADQHPYFVMEYIPGKPIDQYCDAQQLSLRERLRLFVEVCEAVAYAHKVLIIHRDLKPGNILVTDEGEPRLVDFGIAMEQRPPDATRTHYQVFTPEYASPEQVRGEPLDTATDVYSLGVVLYQLVTGSKPYDLAGQIRSEVERLVCEVDPPRPSQRVATEASPEQSTTGRWRRELVGDVDTIVLKALEKRPDDRYESVSELAADIDRHLSREPIEATRRTFFYVARKFVRRNHLAIVASTVIALCVLAGIVGTSIGLLQARYQRREAAAAVQRASERGESALRALKLILVTLQGLDELPATRDLRLLLLDNAIEILEDFKRDESDSRPDHLMVTAYLLLGEIYEFAKGPSGGGLADARRLYQQAFDVAARLEREFPTNPDNVHALIRASIKLGNVTADMGDMSGARELYADSLAMLETHQLVSSTNEDDQRALATCYSNLADAHAGTGDLEKARRYYELSHQLRKALLESHPDVLKNRRRYGISLIQLGNLEFDLGEIDAAAAAYQEAHPLLTKLAEDGSQNPTNHRWLSVSHNKLGNVAAEKGEAEEAFERFTDGLREIETALAADPDNRGFQHDLSVSLIRVGGWYSERGKHAEAQDYYERALQLREKLLSEDSSSALAKRDVYTNLNKLAQSLLGQRDIAGALAYLKRGLTMIKQLQTADPQNIELQYDVFVSYIQLGDALRIDRQYGEAYDWYQQGLEMIYPVIDRSQGPSPRADDVATVESLANYCKARRDEQGEVEAILALPAAQQLLLLPEFGVLTARRGDDADAKTAAEALIGFDPPNAILKYKGAAIYALCVKRIDEQQDADLETRQSYAQRAIDVLAGLSREGFFDQPQHAVYLSKDTAFDALRNHDDFPAVTVTPQRVEQE